MSLLYRVIEPLAEPRYLKRTVTRAALLWGLTRAMLLMLAIALGVDPRFTPFAALLIVAAVAVACHLDAAFMREGVFFGNLRTPAWLPAAAGVVVSGGSEILIYWLTTSPAAGG